VWNGDGFVGDHSSVIKHRIEDTAEGAVESRISSCFSEEVHVIIREVAGAEDVVAE
jgi:hypothetical protein